MDTVCLSRKDTLQATGNATKDVCDFRDRECGPSYTWRLQVRARTGLSEESALRVSAWLRSIQS